LKKYLRISSSLTAGRGARVEGLRVTTSCGSRSENPMTQANVLPIITSNIAKTEFAGIRDDTGSPGLMSITGTIRAAAAIDYNGSIDCTSNMDFTGTMGFAGMTGDTRSLDFLGAMGETNFISNMDFSGGIDFSSITADMDSMFSIGGMFLTGVRSIRCDSNLDMNPFARLLNWKEEESGQ
jgi:hypothetical protein